MRNLIEDIKALFNENKNFVFKLFLSTFALIIVLSQDIIIKHKVDVNHDVKVKFDYYGLRINLP